MGRTVLHNAEGVPSRVRDAQDRLVGLVLAVVDGSLVDSGFESFARLRHVVERFLEILVQAGSHGGAHRVAKAAELVYCDVFDRDAQHVGKDKTSSPRCALPSSHLCMADSRTCPEASRLYMAGQSAETVGRGMKSFIFEEQAAIYKRNTSRRIPKSAIYRRDTACFP